MKRILLVFAVLLTACNNDDDQQTFCTLEIVSGLKVSVKDAMTDELLDGVTVIATDGDYFETLTETTVNDSIFYVGAPERAGNYLLTVSKIGYETQSTTEAIEVKRNECHVITEEVSISLEPL